MIFIAPKNFKNGRLIANKYRWIDLLIAFVLILITIICIVIYVLNNGKNLIVIILFSFPLLLALLILTPLGFYHNLIQKCILWINFKSSRQKYLWQGIYHYIDINNESE